MINKDPYNLNQSYNNPQIQNDFQISLPISNNNITIRQILNQPNNQNYDYFDHSYQQQQQSQLRSSSMNPKSKIRIIQQPNNIHIQHHQPRFAIQPKQDYQTEQMKQNQNFLNNNSMYNHQHRNNIQQRKNDDYLMIQKNQPKKILADQIDITLQNSRKQYKSLERQYQINQDMLKYQQINVYDLPQNNNKSNHYDLPQINNKSTHYDQDRQNKSQQSEKNDSLNCTNTSFMQTKRPICYYCKSIIDKKGINLICWHQYHPECLTEIILCQIQKQSISKLPKCLCGLKLKQQTIRNIQNGQQILKIILEQQLGQIYQKYEKNLNKCPNCEFRFIKNYRLNNECWCPNCEKAFKIK
ncbi:unnamed protein product [Paramecium sonneborni]|uniref:RING-type domain-containing protein n=1 Tax=Paramecium sonneborni TaxID=65129 RepID=A0A8S1RMH1_9CILI|nr:unnamed protein product [Paramecium sonneborni]